MSSAVGIMIGFGCVAVSLILLGRRGRRRDLGSVSHTWVIENRSDRRSDHG
jgi:hypothetical protein